MDDVRLFEAVIVLLFLLVVVVVTWIVTSTLAKNRDMWISYLTQIKGDRWWMECHECGHKFPYDRREGAHSYYDQSTHTYRPECPQCALRANGSHNVYRLDGLSRGAHKAPDLGLSDEMKN